MSYYADDKGKLVPYSGDIPQEAIMAIERADEQTIVERLTRVDAQSVFAYSYPIKTKDGVRDIIGISVDGAKEIANLLGNIKVSSEIKVEEKDDYFYAIVPVTNILRNVTLIGAGAQSKYILGEHNEPTDRIDVLAFVKSISKAQRNGILSIASQETIAEIMIKLDIKAIKKLQAPPSYSALPKGKQVKQKEPVEGKEETLKKLHQQIAIEWGRTGKSDDERKEFQKSEYNVESMTELNEEQLNDMLAKVRDMIPNAERLGFSSQEEQKRMRNELFQHMKALGYTSDAEKRQYITQKGWERTTIMTKERLQSVIDEVKGEVASASKGEQISEDV